MKKYKVTEWGTLIDFDVDENSGPTVASNALPGYDLLRFNYNQSELFSTESEAWIEFRDKKLLELELEFINIKKAEQRIAALEELLQTVKEKI